MPHWRFETTWSAPHAFATNVFVLVILCFPTVNLVYCVFEVNIFFCQKLRELGTLGPRNRVFLNLPINHESLYYVGLLKIISSNETISVIAHDVIRLPLCIKSKQAIFNCFRWQFKWHFAINHSRCETNVWDCQLFSIYNRSVKVSVIGI